MSWQALNRLKEAATLTYPATLWLQIEGDLWVGLKWNGYSGYARLARKSGGRPTEAQIDTVASHLELGCLLQTRIIPRPRYQVVLEPVVTGPSLRA
jgi:hypothetical protein